MIADQSGAFSKDTLDNDHARFRADTSGYSKRTVHWPSLFANFYLYSF